MSIIKPTTTRLQYFFRSGPMPCPYLPGRMERKLFTRLSGPDGAEMNSLLTPAGFRRSHDIVYRPVCPGCRACVPVRIPVERFAMDRASRRVWSANQDVSVDPIPARESHEQYRVFQRYQQDRHSESDMVRMSYADYAAMIEEGSDNSLMFEFRDARGTLIAGMLCDCLADGYSAVYSFFDPAEGRRSLGTHMILAVVETARGFGLPYVYLGYWIADCRKMAYKTRFKPVEILTDEGWQTFSRNV